MANSSTKVKIIISVYIYFKIWIRKLSAVDALYGKVMLLENKCGNNMDVDLPQTVGPKTAFHQLKVCNYVFYLRKISGYTL